MIYKKSWKYILIRDDSYWCNNYCRRIKALKDFSNVSKGDLGGYVHGYRNLSQEGDCWIYDEAVVMDFARVSGNAKICDYATVKETAKVSGNVQISENAWIIGDTEITGEAKISKNIGVSKISGEEFKIKENSLIKIKNWFTKNLGNIF
jgi:NDP-sugar pyrophosphorylase family protein